MALVKCPDCERDVSSRAVACPYCGCPISALAAQYFNEGEQYRVGKGAPQNDEKAVECYQKAAELGLAEAQNSLGEIYYDFGIMQSEGIAKLIKEIVVQKAAEHGTEFQCYEEAIKWYRKAAEQGYADAQCNLADMYHYGWGVPEDDEEAVKWYREAAEQGHADAQCNLADMYRYGFGVPEDDEEAVKWYREAAEQGHADAQCNLGDMYYLGWGVPEDCEEAAKWYQKAARQGNIAAQKALAKMEP